MSRIQLSAGAVLALAGVGVLAILYVKRGAIGASVASAAQAVGDAVNPTSDQNLAYRGANALGASLTGDPFFTVGGSLYDWLHQPSAYQVAAAGGPQLVQTGGDEYGGFDALGNAYGSASNSSTPAFVPTSASYYNTSGRAGSGGAPVSDSYGNYDALGNYTGP